MQRSRRSRVAATTALLAVMLAIPAAGSAANPAGNNGTVKVDGLDFDQHPNNEPHVGCIFEVDFYGFDTGLTADVTFAVKPPSGTDPITLTRSVPLGDNSIRGGSPDAIDAQERFDLGGLFGDAYLHPKQGYHVKLTVEADGATKHKTFWVTDCDCTETQDPPYENQDT